MLSSWLSASVFLGSGARRGIGRVFRIFGLKGSGISCFVSWRV